MKIFKEHFLLKKGRYIDVFEDDVFIVSYPKSGNTWLRFIIANLLNPEQKIDFRTVHDFIPDIGNNFNSQLKKRDRPRILKSHESFDHRYNIVIYIARDPRSVLISYFHYAKRINLIARDYQFDDFFELFMVGKIGSYGSWKDHVGSWLGARKDDPNFHLITYERLKADTFAVVKTISDFLGIDASENQIHQSIAKSSFDSMKKLDNMKKDPFVRSGKVDEWKNYLSEEQNNIIESCFGFSMNLLKY